MSRGCPTNLAEEASWTTLPSWWPVWRRAPPPSAARSSTTSPVCPRARALVWVLRAPGGNRRHRAGSPHLPALCRTLPAAPLHPSAGVVLGRRRRRGRRLLWKGRLCDTGSTAPAGAAMISTPGWAASWGRAPMPWPTNCCPRSAAWRCSRPSDGPTPHWRRSSAGAAHRRSRHSTSASAAPARPCVWARPRTRASRTWRSCCPRRRALSEAPPPMPATSPRRCSCTSTPARRSVGPAPSPAWASLAEWPSSPNSCGRPRCCGFTASCTRTSTRRISVWMARAAPGSSTSAMPSSSRAPATERRRASAWRSSGRSTFTTPASRPRSATRSRCRWGG
mmetsp:Transcript_82768/g.210620  ORF Transcript_82768/g.210620 Transcript_82768/m.210620 type:complete len:336 (-) Transcript_82768:551-1558(-)